MGRENARVTWDSWAEPMILLTKASDTRFPCPDALESSSSDNDQDKTGHWELHEEGTTMFPDLRLRAENRNAEDKVPGHIGSDRRAM